MNYDGHVNSDFNILSLFDVHVYRIHMLRRECDALYSNLFANPEVNLQGSSEEPVHLRLGDLLGSCKATASSIAHIS
jgi:hypothetical protein